MAEPVQVPDGLAGLPVGPDLATALAALPPERIPNDRLLPVLVAQYRQLCHEQARTAAILAEIGRCGPTPVAAGQIARDPAPAYYAPTETRAALRWTRAAADTEHLLSETAVHQMPLVFAAWLDGQIDRPRVRVFDQYLTGLTPQQVRRICAKAVPRAPKLTTGQLAGLLRRMVIAVDPDAAARWYRKSVRDRTVTAYPAPDGTITISATGLAPDEAEAACQRIQRLAAAAKRAGHPGRIGQIRCDLFLGLLDGRLHGMTCEQVIATLIAGYRVGDPNNTIPTPGETPQEEAPAPATGHTDGGHTDGGHTGHGDDHTDHADHADRDGGVHGGDLAHRNESTSATEARPEPVSGTAHGAERAPWAEPEQDGEPVQDGEPDPADVPGAVVGDQRHGIEIRISLATLLGHDQHPGEIPGLGLILADDARLLVTRQTRARWRFAITNPTGTLLSEGQTRHRPTGAHRDGPPGGIVELHIPETLLHTLAADPDTAGPWAGVIADIAAQHADRAHRSTQQDAHPDARLPAAALRRHTQIRDRNCTFAGVCRHPASTADIDHTRNHAAGGATVQTNLGPLCDHDHGVKHRGGWTVTQDPPGVFTWHSPLGGVYPARGEFLLPDLPEPAPSEPDPWIEQPPLTDDGPILRRPPARPEAPRPPPPPPVDPDEPCPF